VAKVPQVLGAVVKVPGGAGEDLSGGDFEENGVDDPVLIVFGFVGQARDEPVSDEGEEKVLVINVVQRQHGAAIEQQLSGERLEAEVFERKTERWLGAAGEERNGEEKQAGQGRAAEAVGRRNGEFGNRHGRWRVSLHYRQRVGVMFHRRMSRGNVCRK